MRGVAAQETNNHCGDGEVQRITVAGRNIGQAGDDLQRCGVAEIESRQKRRAIEKKGADGGRKGPEDPRS